MGCAMRLSLFDKIFVQGDTLGMASFHFVTDDEAFISYESVACTDWRLGDGNALPSKRKFAAASFDADTRTFRGVLSWAPTSFCGDERWEYEMVFAPDYSGIVGGQIHHFTPGLTDWWSPEQAHAFVDQATPSANGRVLRYTR